MEFSGPNCICLSRKHPSSGEARNNLLATVFSALFLEPCNFALFDLFQEEPVKADSDDDMLNVNGELSLTGGVMVRPASGSMISNEPSDIMREGDLGLGAVGGAQA